MPYLLLGVGLAVLGVMAMSYIVNNFWPFDVNQRLDLARATALGRADPTILLEAANSEIVLAFLATAALTVTGLFLPLVYYLNKRFNKGTLPPFLLILRQSMWLGAWVAFCIWLQMHRTLGIAIAILVAGVLTLFEVLLQVRTRARSHAEAFEGAG